MTFLIIMFGMLVLLMLYDDKPYHSTAKEFIIFLIILLSLPFVLNIIWYLLDYFNLLPTSIIKKLKLVFYILEAIVGIIISFFILTAAIFGGSIVAIVIFFGLVEIIFIALIYFFLRVCVHIKNIWYIALIILGLHPLLFYVFLLIFENR